MEKEPEPPDPRLKFVYDEAVRAIDRQAGRLDDLARSANLFAAGSIATGFLGAEAFRTDGEPSGWAWIAAGTFVIVGMLTVCVLSPTPGWKFTFNVGKLQDEWVAGGHTIDAMYSRLAGYLDDNYRTNEEKLRYRAYALVAIVALLVVEMLALFIALVRGA